MSNEQRAHIYTLLDPRTNEVRYVGSTINPKLRRSAHRHDGVTDSFAIRRWKRGLFAEGMRPEFKVVEVCSVEAAQRREQAWIDMMRDEGADLLNKQKVRDIRWRRSGYKQPRKSSR